MYDFFTTAAAPFQAIQDAKQKVSSTLKYDAMQVSTKQDTRNRLPLALTYLPLIHKIKGIIYSNFKRVLKNGNSDAKHTLISGASAQPVDAILTSIIFSPTELSKLLASQQLTLWTLSTT